VYHAMMLGLRDYVNKNRFPGVVLGLSGGIDSALTAAVAVDALGASRVRGVRLPSPFTSDASMVDAAETARLLGVTLETLPIDSGVRAVEETLAPVFVGRTRDVTEENVQARLRGVLLMAVSNKFGEMVVTPATSRKCRSAIPHSMATCVAATQYSRTSTKPRCTHSRGGAMRTSRAGHWVHRDASSRSHR
jgi:NAD+ synthetase